MNHSISTRSHHSFVRGLIPPLSFLSVIAIITSCSLINLVPSRKLYPLSFTEEPPNQEYRFIYQDRYNSPGLDALVAVYQLDQLGSGSDNDFQQSLHLLNWTNSRWEHSGSNLPSESRTEVILEEAQHGKKFRCVEYGIVLRSVLAARGIKARTLSLKSRDVETTWLGAGHVATEAWSEIHQKWFFLDAQFNLVPVISDIPLNAVEFQEAILNNQSFQLIDVNGEISQKRRKKYLNFIAKYLYHFDFRFDQREIPYDSLVTVNNKSSLMLIPQGAERPDVFQRKIEMDHLAYTSSLIDFYRPPSSQ